VVARERPATLGGCFVEMMFTLDIGTKLNIGLWINDIKVSAEGIVVTRLRNLGNGIQFTKLAAEDQARLKQFLKWPQLVREDP
jgi:PilZ domain-containing protein